MKTTYQNFSYHPSNENLFYKKLNSILFFLKMDKLKKDSYKINNFLQFFLSFFLNKQKYDHVQISLKVEDFPNDYHLSSHFCGAQLLQEEETFQDVFPSQGDVLGHNYDYLYKGDWENKLKHNLGYLKFFLLSTLGDFRHSLVEQRNLSLENIYIYLHKHKNRTSQYFYDNFLPEMFYYKLNKLY